MKEEIVEFVTEPEISVIHFHKRHGEIIGTLTNNDNELSFEGNADESAKVFVDAIIKTFKLRKNI